MHAQATHCLVQVPAWRSVSYRAHRRHHWPDHETAHRLITSEQVLFNFGRSGMCPAFGAFGCRRSTTKEQNCEANDPVLGHFLSPGIEPIGLYQSLRSGAAVRRRRPSWRWRRSGDRGCCWRRTRGRTRRCNRRCHRCYWRRRDNATTVRLLLWIPRLLRIPGLLWISQLLRLSRLRLLSISSG
jgi:hypothetical protein